MSDSREPESSISQQPGSNGMQQFCRALLSDQQRLDEVSAALDKRGLLDGQLKADLSSGLLSAPEQFKRIAGAVEKHLATLIGDTTRVDDDLVRLVKVVERSARLDRMVRNEEVLRTLFGKARLPLTGPLRLAKTPVTGRANVSFLVHTDNERYFLKYHAPLGSEFFQRHAPGKAVFTSVLCNRLHAALLGDERVIEILYPSLESASDRRSGNEPSGDLEFLSDAILIQPDVSEACVELVRYHELDLSVQQAAVVLARALGQRHGLSHGIAARYRDEVRRDEVLRLLDAAGEDIRFPSSLSYEAWIACRHWIRKPFDTMLQYASMGRRALFSHVQAVLAGGGFDLSVLYHELCCRSVERFDEHAVLGHLDLTMKNVFVSRASPSEYKLFDFDYVAFVEPAYERGNSLYTVLRHCFRSGQATDVQATRVLLQAFDAAYEDAFRDAQKEQATWATPLANPAAFRDDARAFSGLILLTALSTEHPELACNPSFIAAATPLLTELLMAGALT